jgi:hypothetical protein
MKIFSLNSINNGGSIVGHVLSQNSGVGYVTGLNSVSFNVINSSSSNSAPTSINTMSPLSQSQPSPASITSQEQAPVNITQSYGLTSFNTSSETRLSDNQFNELKQYILATEEKVTNISNEMNNVQDRLEFMINNYNILEDRYYSIKTCISEIDIKTEEKLCLVLMKIQSLEQITIGGGVLPIPMEQLTEIYECFIKPFVDCEYYRMGNILKVIEVNKMLCALLENPDINEKTKLVISMLKDVMTAVVNARNSFINQIALEKQMKQLREKYNKCSYMVATLEMKIRDLLDNEEYSMGQLRGDIKIKLWQPKSMLYIQAKFDIDRAWYEYLYDTKKLEPDKYSATISYVRSFGTRQAAYNELIRLLDERSATLEEELENAAQENENQIEEIPE